MPADLPCVIDIEASGFGHGSYPIEIGFVRSDGQAWCSLIRPAAGWTHWDAGAARLHGIERETLMRSGRSAQEVATLLNRQLAGSTAYCDGWAHDYSWLGVLFEAADLVPSFRLASVRQLIDEHQLTRLDGLRQAGFASLGIDRHRASSDARALQWAIGRLLGPAESVTGRPN